MRLLVITSAVELTCLYIEELVII